MDRRRPLAARDGSPPQPQPQPQPQPRNRASAFGWWSTLAWTLLAFVLLGQWPLAAAMRPDRVRELRQETIDMFYHGFDNYMQVAFPEDEVRCLFSLLPARVFFPVIADV